MYLMKSLEEFNNKNNKGLTLKEIASIHETKESVRCITSDNTEFDVSFIRNEKDDGAFNVLEFSWSYGNVENSVVLGMKIPPSKSIVEIQVEITSSTLDLWERVNRQLDVKMSCNDVDEYHYENNRLRRVVDVFNNTIFNKVGNDLEDVYKYLLHKELRNVVIKYKDR